MRSNSDRAISFPRNNTSTANSVFVRCFANKWGSTATPPMVTSIPPNILTRISGITAGRGLCMAQSLKGICAGARLGRVRPRRCSASPAASASHARWRADERGTSPPDSTTAATKIASHTVASSVESTMRSTSAREAESTMARSSPFARRKTRLSSVAQYTVAVRSTWVSTPALRNARHAAATSPL